MTKEDILLVKRDIAARLPYEPIVTNDRFDHGYGHGLYLGDLSISQYFDSANIDGTKVYLRPMSSMTKAEYDEFSKIKRMRSYKDVGTWIELYTINSDIVDWFLSHHFDYRGLIEKGLALEAPEGMYKID